MTVSVALCTYNGATYLAEQVLSILNQTMPPTQIVVSDDGSTDETLQVLDQVLSAWSTAHPGDTLEVMLLRNATALGVTANFEQALAACTGQLIALSDQDDVWVPERLEQMAAEFDRRPALQLLHADARLVDEAGNPLGYSLLSTLGVSTTDLTAVHEGRALDALLRRNIVTGATMMVRRELVARARPFPPAWVHDEWLAVVAAATGLVDLLEKPLTDYRQHGSNQIGVTTLDASGKLGRLRAPRSARNARLLARATALQDRAPALDPAPSDLVLQTIAAKVAHEQMRSGLAPARLFRIPPILRAWRAGNYTRFGLGLQDVLRDLVQPV
ncbi:glycosyltransferase family 2 protein [Cryobacterium sp. CG_9.6]|uniref:glycosyltransferase family 2 protein n=1 Tax=Cryobacterium sp. CG_9.6 TaxID=2760710 RepID=UPI0024732206|nr:glycosyltransferase family 2 protein [Cryobacterium sp. CG_9.6]MDH6235955.1 glycosyltransferase involved in cell wall biosynthesis [Cryobacterium sp. CG_9.6]